MKDDIQAVNEVLDARDEEISKIHKQIEDLTENMNENGSKCERKNNIANSRMEELKKAQQQLKEDLQFYKSMNQMMNEAKGQ